jgi:hypothetical protein
MSASGQKQTCATHKPMSLCAIAGGMSALTPKAEINRSRYDACLVPIGDITLSLDPTLLLSLNCAWGWRYVDIQSI